MIRLQLCGLALCVGLLSACGSALQNGPSSIASLREQAAAAPRDPALASKLALAEHFSYEGDPARVDAALEHALALAPEDPRLWLARGLVNDMHGSPRAALDAYLNALRFSPASTDPVAPQLGEVAALAIAALEGTVPGYAERVRSAAEPLLDEPRLGSPARYALGTLLIQLAYRRGDRPAAQALAAKLGCVTELRAAGPFGPRELLGFDQAQPVKPGQPLAASYDLGPGRGVQAVRELGARGCSVNLGGGPLAEGGTSFAQAYVDAAASGAYVLRLQVPSAVEVWVDGRSLVKLDRRRTLYPDVVFLPLQLSQGRHELTVKVSTHHPNPVLSIALAAERPRDGAAIGLPFAADSQGGFAKYLRATIALARGDTLAARQSIGEVSSDRPASALLLLQRANLTLTDPLVPSDQREDGARQLYEKALARDPQIWNASLQLSGMMAGNGRALEAIAALREASARFPEVPAIGYALVDLLRKQGWDAEADGVIERLRRLVPDACSPLSLELAALRERKRESAAEQTTEALMRCEAQANARYSLLLRKRKWDEAERELDRLQALEPKQNVYPWLLARLELAKNRGDGAAMDRLIGELRTRFPRSGTVAYEQIDRLLAKGEHSAALDTLLKAVKAEPTSLMELQRLAPVLGGQHVMAPYRRDGAKQIAAFEAKGKQYDSPQVLVFDYMAARVFEDGSSIELVHTIQKAQSDEAVNELGEVHVPEGALVLKLQAIKPNGERLEPDRIEGKDAISLPTVTPGDYVEFEYLQYKEPSEAFPDGYAGERFFFKSFEIPFDHSEMVVVVPEGLAVQNDKRGPAPVAEERRADGLRVLTYQVNESEALKAEPDAVAAREYLPSIRIGARATWPAFVESIRDVLIDRDLYDPDVAALARRIAGEPDPKDPHARARRLYNWVLGNVDNNEDVFSQAALMLRARAGNRARVLRYMLDLAGIPAHLALVRSAAADNVETEMADGDTYEHLLVMLPGAQPAWLFTVERYAPFGFLPPQLAGQPALLLDAKATRARVPAQRPGTNLRRIQFDVELRADGSAHVDAVERVHGSGAVSWRDELESVPAAELQQRFEAEYASRLVPGATLSNVTIEGAKQRSAAIDLKYGLDLYALGRRVQNGWALPPLLAARLAHNYAQLSQRTTDELVPSPLEFEVVLRVKLPKGTARPRLPEKVELEAAIPGRPRFTLDSRFEGDAIVIERKLNLPTMRISPADYPAFASFCQMVDAAEGKELVVPLK